MQHVWPFVAIFVATLKTMVRGIRHLRQRFTSIRKPILRGLIWLLYGLPLSASLTTQAHPLTPPPLTLTLAHSDYSLTPHIAWLRAQTPAGLRGCTFDEIRSETYAGAFIPFSAENPSPDAAVHWLRFSLQNNDRQHESFLISITFTDHIQL